MEFFRVILFILIPSLAVSDEQSKTWQATEIPILLQSSHNFFSKKSSMVESAQIVCQTSLAGSGEHVKLQNRRKVRVKPLKSTSILKNTDAVIDISKSQRNWKTEQKSHPNQDLTKISSKIPQIGG